MLVVKPVKSSVTPDGTATDDRTIVEQDFLDLLAKDAPLEPEKVQVVALLSMSGAAVGSGAAMGLAKVATALNASTAARTLNEGAISLSIAGELCFVTLRRVKDSTTF